MENSSKKRDSRCLLSLNRSDKKKFNGRLCLVNNKIAAAAVNVKRNKKSDCNPKQNFHHISTTEKILFI